MRAILAGGLLLVTTPALADELTETRGGALHDGVDPEVEIMPADLDVTWRLDGTLATRTTATDGDSATEGTASVGGEFAVSHVDCDIVAVGGQLDVGTGVPVSAQQWASLCPLAGDMVMHLNHALQWDVVPTLLARPRLRPDASRVETFSVTMGARSDMFDEEGEPEDDAYMTFVRTTMGVSIGWVAGHGEEAAADVSAVSAFIGYHRDRDGDVPLDIDVFGVAMEGITPADHGDDDPSNDGMAMLARIDGVRWTGAKWGDVRIDGALGVGFVSAGVGALPPHQDTLVIVTEPELGAEYDLDDELTVRGSVARTHWAVYDGRAVIDDRAAVALTRRAGRVRLRAEGFAALSYLIAGDHQITRAVTGGLTCVAETDLGDHAVMRVRSDLGQGFYASGATLEDPRLAGEVLATIDLHAGNR